MGGGNPRGRERREGGREEGEGGMGEDKITCNNIYLLTFSSNSMLVVLPPLAHFVVVVVVVSSLSHQGEEKACLSCEISLVVDTPCIRGTVSVEASVSRRRSMFSINPGVPSASLSQNFPPRPCSADWSKLVLGNTEGSMDGRVSGIPTCTMISK